MKNLMPFIEAANYHGSNLCTHFIFPTKTKTQVKSHSTL